MPIDISAHLQRPNALSPLHIRSQAGAQQQMRPCSLINVIPQRCNAPPLHATNTIQQDVADGQIRLLGSKWNDTIFSKIELIVAIAMSEAVG